MALDPGERRVGVALSDPAGVVASPHRVLDRRTENVLSEIARICEAEDVARIVVGLPVALSGEEGPSAAAARAFASEVEETTGIDVVLHDERFTSVTAESALLEAGVRRRERRQRRDKVAAAVLLQSFLDTERHRGDEHPADNDT